MMEAAEDAHREEIQKVKIEIGDDSEMREVQSMMQSISEQMYQQSLVLSELSKKIGQKSLPRREQPSKLPDTSLPTVAFLQPEPKISHM
ncbi:hypothetical protein A2U01_0064108, partial [Trifolium medium]|nr:hypothetical protein [Trifolium medium]